MSFFSKTFASESRSELLRALLYQPDPLGFRALTEVTGLSLGSVQNVLPKLVKQGWVTRDKSGRRFSINRRHPIFPMVRDILRIATAAELPTQAANLTPRSTSVMLLCDEMHALFRNTRSRRGKEQ